VNLYSSSVLDTVNPTQHHPWCHAGACVTTDDNIIHNSVISSVDNAAVPDTTIEVQTQDFYFADPHGRMRPCETQPGPTIQLHEHGHDGWDLTPTEARQLAQALVNHADLADNTLMVSPLDRATTLLVSMLADTGTDVNELHTAVKALLCRLVDALVEVRR